MYVWTVMECVISDGGSMISDGVRALPQLCIQITVTMVALIFRSFCGIVGANYSHSKSVPPW